MRTASLKTHTMRNVSAVVFLGAFLLGSPRVLKVQAFDCDGTEDMYCLGASNTTAGDAEANCASFDCSSICSSGSCEGYVGEGSPDCAGAEYLGGYYYSEGTCYCHDVPI
jgi:hypothetical protein